MGVLDNTTITVDAILTKKGRELLAKGEGQFKITKFSLGDDEIDYNLYDVTHPNGSNFYGAVIENMNLLEAIPNQDLALKYPLGDYEGNTGGGGTGGGDTGNYVLTANPTSATINGGFASVFQFTLTGWGGASDFSYSLTDTTYASLLQANPTTGTVRVRTTTPPSTKSTVLNVTENNTGKTLSVPITINKYDGIIK